MGQAGVAPSRSLARPGLRASVSSDRRAQKPTAGPTPAGRARLTTIIGRIKAMAGAIGALPLDLGKGPCPIVHARPDRSKLQPRRDRRKIEPVLLDENPSPASSPATAIKK